MTIISYALTVVVMAFGLGLAATLVSALGAGLRVLPRTVAALRGRGVGENT